MKAEIDTYYEVEQTIGTASSRVDEDEGHGTHAYLYLPDLSSRTGWASHAVPERRDKPQERHPIGFRRVTR